MYCNSCNKYISDSSKHYCDYCGAYLGNQNIMPTPTTNTTLMDLPRGDVVNYLYIVKSLECVKSEMKKRVEENERKIEAYRQPVYLPEVKAEKDGEISVLTTPSTNYFRYIDWPIAAMSLALAIVTFVVLMVLCFIFFFFVVVFDINNAIIRSHSFENTLFYATVAISVGVLVVGWVRAFLIIPPSDRNDAIKRYNKSLILNAEILDENQKKQLGFKSDSATREAKIRQIEKENELKAQQEERELAKNKQQLSAIENELTSAYSLNIIPKEFRGLEAVIFIFDFMDSSRETLSATLLHLRINNATKIILDYVRTVDQRVLANQALINALNGSLNTLRSQNINIQKTINNTNSLLRDIKPFNDNKK